jgi:hypothetical protein
MRLITRSESIRKLCKGDFTVSQAHIVLNHARKWLMQNGRDGFDPVYINKRARDNKPKTFTES